MTKTPASPKHPLQDVSAKSRRVSPRHPQKTPKVALVMDWLTDVGGAERVLKSISEIYPSAPIYTSQYRPQKIDWFKDREVKTGWLNIFPAKLRRFISPLRQLYFNHLDLSDYDLVISVTGAEAKSVKTRGNHHSATHVCYCHVPTQYYWGFYDQYLENPGFGILNPLARLGLKIFVKPLRKADYKAAQRPDYFVSISNYAADQIKKYYKREVKVIHPPVSTELFRNPVENSKTKKGIVKHKKPEQPEQIRNNSGSSHKKGNQTSPINISPTTHCVGCNRSPLGIQTIAAKSHNDGRKERSNVWDGICGAYFINFSRQVSWKRLDLAIKACINTKHHLLLIGSGPEHNSLVKLADDSEYIHFLPQMPQSDLKKYLSGASAFIFPSLEPFGIAPLEALSAGCPVIAYGAGGALDYIEDGKNGLLFNRQSANSLAKSIRAFDALVESRPDPFPAKALQDSAARFSDLRFKKKLKDFIDEKISR